MERDYAKRYYMRKTKNHKPKKWLIIVISILVLGAGIGVTVKLYPEIFIKEPRISAFLARLKSNFVKQPLDALGIKKQKIEEQPEVHFSFYNALPNMRVEVPSSRPEAPTSVLTSTQTGYILQFGVFKEYAEASRLRLSLLLTGIETEIERVSNSQGVAFRVQQGPFLTRGESRLYQQKWQKKGIETILKKLGGGLGAV
jgi:hypothetical protein